jgi:hypothetical protein
MDVALVIRHRLRDLGYEQRDLAAATHVTESYVSQLLARKKAPPAPRRTEIYNRMETFLRLPRGELSRLAEVQRREELKKKIADPVSPLFSDLRTLLLTKCRAESRGGIRAILQKESFGELERLVAQKFLDVAKDTAKVPAFREKWLDVTVRLNRWTRESTHSIFRKLMRIGIFTASVEHCVPLLDALIEEWNIDLATFSIQIAMNREISPEALKRFEFVEQAPDDEFAMQRGLQEFLEDKSLSGDATEEEIRFLKKLSLKGRRPAPIYYYRELQNLRDPVHFRDSI